MIVTEFYELGVKEDALVGLCTFGHSYSRSRAGLQSILPVLQKRKHWSARRGVLSFDKHMVKDETPERD